MNRLLSGLLVVSAVFLVINGLFGSPAIEPLASESEAACVGGFGLFNDTDCVAGGTSCTISTPKPALIPCGSVGVGGICTSAGGWCAATQTGMVVGPVHTQMFPGSTPTTSTATCHRSFLVCKATGTCSGTTSGPNPVCGTYSKCVD